MTDWLHECIVELQDREEHYRNHPQKSEEEYWSAVANGISEALEIVEEADRKRAAESVEDN